MHALACMRLRVCAYGPQRGAHSLIDCEVLIASALCESGTGSGYKTSFLKPYSAPEHHGKQPSRRGGEETRAERVINHGYIVLNKNKKNRNPEDRTHTHTSSVQHKKPSVTVSKKTVAPRRKPRRYSACTPDLVGNFGWSV